MSGVTVLEVQGLWKHYGLPLPKMLLPFFGSFAASERAALKNIHFELKRGETLGVIGYNGAGKSTLLKVLAGVTAQTRGTVNLRGRVFPMIELNAGLHPDMTGRENVKLLSAIMGLSRSAIQSTLPAIEAFCELGEWFDLPVRTYSSGMLVRLGFGVAINIRADILLIDEVLAVGDLPFQRKCYNQFERLRQQGVSIIFVSHNIRQIERICDRVMLLHQGETLCIGEPEEVCLRYHKMSSARDMECVRMLLPEIATWQCSGELTVTSVTVMDANGSPTSEFMPCAGMKILIQYQSEVAVVHPVVGIRIITSDMMRIADFSTGDRFPTAAIHPGTGWIEAAINALPLLQGVYSIGVTIKAPDGRCIYTGENLAFFGISYAAETRNNFGIVHIDAQWAFSHNTL
ncbi:MAG: ABC transporter ATP-binding protein [Desulfobacterota bacterium]|nr:ABC transporter ATP-binding protein [Thermodesulfobacteriota bacterium]